MNTTAPIPQFDHYLSIFLADLRTWVFKSQSQAARHFGLTHSTISRYENGHLKPPIGYLACHAQLFDERLVNASPNPEQHRSVLLGEINKAIQRCYPDEKRFQSWAELCQVAKTHMAAQSTAPSTTISTEQRIEWGDAPDVSTFYGRMQELKQLQTWVTTDNCRIVAVLGLGGIGKTALVAKLAEHLQDEFEYIIWRSLRNAPTISEMLRNYWQVLSHRVDEQEQPLFEADTARLLEYLRRHRCLLVLDNIEAIMQAGEQAGYYRTGYELYGEFLRRIGESQHKSCLVLTGRERPGELDLWPNNRGPVRTLQLTGVGAVEALQILKDRNLTGAPDDWQALVKAYSGNPLALKLVAETIHEVFDGDIARFLADDHLIFSGVRRLLDQQFARLTPFEIEILYWLAVAREPQTADDLNRDLVQPPVGSTLVDTLHSLRRRSLMEKNGSGFALQNVVAEYVIDHFITRTHTEILLEQLTLLHHVAWLKAEAHEDVRQTQTRLILDPIARQLAASLGRAKLVTTVQRLLSALRLQEGLAKGYGAGNLLNLLLHLGYDLRGSDFSGLAVWQADLREASLPEVDFTGSSLAHTVFCNTFVGVNAVALSPNGKLLAVATGQEVRIWDVTTSQLYAILVIDHTDLVWTIAFDPQGQLLASGGADRTVRLWNVQTLELICTFYGHTDWVWTVAFCPTTGILASSSEDHTIRLWDIQTKEVAGILKAESGPLRTVAFSPQGRFLAGSGGPMVCIWDLSNQRVRHRLQGHTGTVFSIAFSPNGEHLASGSADHTVRIWNTHTGECQQIRQGHTNTVAAVAFSQDGNTIASGSYDHTACLWNMLTHQAPRVLHGHSQAVRSATFDRHGDLLVTGSYDQTVRIWDTNHGRIVHTFRGHTYEIKALAFSVNGSYVASGGTDHKVRVWQLSTGRLLHTFTEHNRWVSSVAFSPNSELLVSGSCDRTARIWDVNSGKLLLSLQNRDGWIWSVAFSPTGALLAVGGANMALRLWDVQTGQHIQTLSGHEHGIWSVAFSPNDSLLASGSEDRTIRLWDRQRGTTTHVLRGHSSLVACLAFSRSGRLLASSDRDGTVHLWDTETGELLQRLPRAGGSVSALMFSADEKILVSSNEDQLLQQWNIQTGQLLPGRSLPNEANSALAFSADGEMLASGSLHGTINLWQVTSGNLAQKFQIIRPYEGMQIAGVTGLTEAQKATLVALGATSD